MKYGVSVKQKSRHVVGVNHVAVNGSSRAIQQIKLHSYNPTTSHRKYGSRNPSKIVKLHYGR